MVQEILRAALVGVLLAASAMSDASEGGAGWVWAPGEVNASMENLHVYFRRSFDLQGKPERAVLQVSADSRYVLYLNGKLLGRGPLKGDLKHYSYEVYDLKPLLSSGTNVLAAHVHHGTGIQSEIHSGHGGFYCKGEVELQGAKMIELSTPGKWKCTTATGWQDNRARRTGYLAYVADFDANKDPQGWQTPGLDDSGWVAPAAVNDTPWQMQMRDLPQMSETPVRCARVVEAGRVETQDPKSPRMAPDEARIRDAQGLAKGRPVFVPADPDRDSYFVVDFGQELTGNVRFRLRGTKGATVQWRYAEHPGAYIGAADTYTLRDGTQSFETFHYQGFRYLEVKVHNPKASLYIEGLEAVFVTYPLEQQGSFKCSDPLLNRIWDVGCHSLKCCLHETYEDCPGYEQLQYCGDARVETLVQMAAFGDPRPFARGLKAISWSVQPDGITFSRYPCNETQIIPTFSLIWIISLEDYLLWSGDHELVREMLPVADGILEWFNGHVGADGVLTDVPHWVFLDWSGDLGRPEAGGASSVLNAFYYGALRSAARLTDLRGDVEASRRYRDRARSLKTAFDRAFWSPESGAYVNDLRNGQQGKGLSQHAQALALLYEIAPTERKDALVTQMLREDTMQATPYFMFYVLRALDQAGRYDLAADQMRRWKSMLDAGATTWLETWGNKRSWCHAWSSAPTYELSTRVLGIRPSAAGFAKATIEPCTTGLQWAKGSVPTPRGTICADWWMKDGKLYLNYSAPHGMAVEPKTPRGSVVRRLPYKP